MGSWVPSLFGRLLKSVLVAVVVLVLAVVALDTIPGALMDKVRDQVAALNPFQDETIDRTGPSVRESLTSLSEFHAAGAYFETVVDLEKDTEFLPDFISGEQVLYVGKGHVDAVVDFRLLDERQVVLSDDGTSAAITLPAPTLGEPVLDLEESYVAYRDEGFLNTFRGSDLEREAQLRAVEQMSAAAKEDGSLVDLAEESTILMLRGLLGALGYTDVTVTFG